MAVEVFTGADQLFDRLFVVTDDAVLVANPPSETLPAIASSVRGGAPVKTLVTDAEEFPFAAITAVKANMFRDSMIIEYNQGPKSRLKDVHFKDAATRNNALTALEKRLGSRFQKRMEQYGLVKAALAPLLTTIGFAAFTYISVLAAAALAAGEEEAEIRGRQQLLKRLFVWAMELLGPIGIGIAGGLIVLGCLFWLIGRIRQPPLMVILTPRKGRPT